MSQFAIGRKVRINADMTPPPTASHTGEMYRGKPVYKEKAFANVRVQIGTNPRTGQPVEVDRLDRENFTEVEFVLNDLGNGQVQKNYDFRAPEAGSLPAAAPSEMQQLRADYDALRKVVANLIPMGQPTTPDTDEDEGLYVEPFEVDEDED